MIFSVFVPFEPGTVKNEVIFRAQRYEESDLLRQGDVIRTTAHDRLAARPAPAVERVQHHAANARENGQNKTGAWRASSPVYSAVM